MMNLFKRLARVPLRCFYALCAAFSPAIVRICYTDGGIWALKKSLQDRPGELRKRIYFDYLKRKGSWIGIHSVFEEVPCFPHGIYGIFVSDKAHVGKGAVIFHQVTIGSNTLPDSRSIGSPRIGDNVYIGCGAKIIGNVRIGNHARIGANAVIVKDVPDNTTAVAPQTRIIPKEDALDNRFIPIDRLDR